MCWKRRGNGCARTKERPGWMASGSNRYDVRPRRGGIAGRDTVLVAHEDLPAAGGAASLHSEGEWETEAVGHTDGQCELHWTTNRIWDGRKSAIPSIRFAA